MTSMDPRLNSVCPRAKLHEYRLHDMRMTEAQRAEIAAPVHKGDPVGPWIVDAALMRARGCSDENDHKRTEDMTTENSHLSAAVDALGKIMLEMQRRRLLLRPGANTKTRELLSEKSLTDEQIGTLAADAFESGAMELARRGFPGVSVHVCNPSEEPR
jgi:hypothetical protein